MTRRPTRSTRNDTRVPYKTLFRSELAERVQFRIELPVARLLIDDGDLVRSRKRGDHGPQRHAGRNVVGLDQEIALRRLLWRQAVQQRDLGALRSEAPTSELQSLMRISYALFCLTKTKYKTRL